MKALQVFSQRGRSEGKTLVSQICSISRCVQCAITLLCRRVSAFIYITCVALIAQLCFYLFASVSNARLDPFQLPVMLNGFTVAAESAESSQIETD